MTRSVAMTSVLLMLTAVPRAEAQPRERCASERAAAQAHYLEGRFGEAARLLHACIDQNPLFVEEALKVYRLLGLVYLYQNARAEAVGAVERLLELDPRYQADEVQDPPSYVALVEAVRAQRGPPPAETLPEQPTPEVDAETNAPPPLLPPPETRLDPQPRPDGSPPLGLHRAKTWLLATGGAVVVFTAALLAVGR